MGDYSQSLPPGSFSQSLRIRQPSSPSSRVRGLTIVPVRGVGGISGLSGSVCSGISGI
jgi:hypothetical protein